MPADHESTDFDLQSVEISEVFEGVKAVLLAPVLLPLVSTVNQPLVKAAIREGIAFSERCQDAVADAQERLDDIFAEAQAEVDAQRRSPRTTTDAYTHEAETNGSERSSRESSLPDSSDLSASSPAVFVQRGAMSSRPSGASMMGEATQTASQISDMVHELNGQVRWLTNDTLDLRVLMTTALGAFALRQLVVRGLRLDEIPWYVAAWYALDTFVKFHPDDRASAVTSPSSQATDQLPQTIDMEQSS